MLANKDFYEYDCMISYPIAGAFVKYLIDCYGMERFIALYTCRDEDYATVFVSIYRHSLDEIEKEFWNVLSSVKIDIERINAALNED